MNYTILIIEDDADTRDALAMYLSYEGYNVRMAPYRDCAMGMLGNLNAILMDYNMPGMSPEKFLANLKEKSLYPVVILMTAQSIAKTKAAQLGLKYHIEKPFLLEDLGALIGRSIKEYIC
jgi:DNA-binding NtrC family response regulator